MKHLSHVQTEFAQCLSQFPQGMTIPEDLFQSGELSITAGLSVYQNNHIVALRNALSAGFPVLQQLLGEQGFSLMSKDYLQSHPSESGDLADLGAHLPDFLQSYEPLLAYPYLSDVAQLEWLWQMAHMAEDRNAVRLEDLVTLGDEALLTSSVSFSPAVHLLACQYAAGSIWLAHQDEGDLRELTDEKINQPEYVLIARPQWRVLIQTLTHAQYQFLRSLQQGHSFEETFERMEQLELPVDFSSDLPMWLALGIWASMRPNV